MPRAKLTIVVSGMIAGDPNQGGATFAVLQYLLGFKRLGHEFYFIEPVKEAKLRPTGAPLAVSTNSSYFRQVIADFSLERSATLLLEGTRNTVGLSYARLQEAAARADILINIAGMLTDPELTGRIPVRAYLDLDPAFTQLWHEAQGIDMRFSGHTHFVTIGQSIGDRKCAIPTCGLRWIKTLQPVVLKQWPVAGRILHNGLTTIGNWRGYGSIEHRGVFYGQKAHSLRMFMDLPARTRERFIPALAIDPAEVHDLRALAEHGWRLIDPAEVASTPDRYRRFIQGSKAEFGIAKSGYVASRCGWFSDRSACYLASGRPVLAQETGFSDYLPTGAGLCTFQNADDVLAAIDRMNADYPHHCRAARAIADDFFDSDKVLTQLLERLGALS